MFVKQEQGGIGMGIKGTAPQTKIEHVLCTISKLTLFKNVISPFEVNCVEISKMISKVQYSKRLYIQRCKLFS